VFLETHIIVGVAARDCTRLELESRVDALSASMRSLLIKRNDRVGANSAPTLPNYVANVLPA
jgi:hypothetical protein